MVSWRRRVTHRVNQLLGFSMVPVLLVQPASLVSPLAAAPILGETEAFATLADGQYQFCSEPAPADWRDGDGVCLNIWKNGAQMDGYYGYPHSSQFVCLRGQVANDQMLGEGMVIFWAAHDWAEIPHEEFFWDDEARLQLSEGYVAHSEGEAEEMTQWIVFRTARLNLGGFYRYDTATMTPPAQLCQWPG